MTDQLGIAESLRRSYMTALALLEDEARAEGLVAEAIRNLDPNGVTGRNIRDAVVARLVMLQLSS